MSKPEPAFSERDAVLLLVDIAGVLAALRGKSALDAANFFDDFYTLCDAEIGARGGHVVKYLGDSTLAMFEPDAALPALEAAAAIRSGFADVCTRHATSADVRINLHHGNVVHGHFGPQGLEDVLGSNVNTLMTMPSRVGYTITERVYRQLPSQARSPWEKHKTPVFYTLN